jgi:hypothetical protein
MYRTRRLRMGCGRTPGLGRGGLPVVAAVLLVLGCVRAAEAEKTALVFSATPGDTLHYDVQMSREGSMGGVTFTLMQKGRVHVAAIEKGADKTRLSVRFSGFEASLKRGDELIPQKSDLNGVTVEAVVSPRGEVTDIKPKGAVPPGSVEQVQNLADNIIPYLPEAPVDAGATWVRKRVVPNKADPAGKPQIDGSTEFTLDGTKKKDGVQVASILGKTTAKVGLQMPMGLFDGKATGDSQLLVTVQGGHILECKASSDYSGKVGENDLGWSQTFSVKLVK